MKENERAGGVEGDVGLSFGAEQLRSFATLRMTIAREGVDASRSEGGG